MAEFTEMLNPQGAAPMPPAQPMQMTQMLQPNPLTPTPAGTPEELAARKSGWRTVLANPNFQRALMFAGQAMAQPFGHGQTPISHLANSIGVGTTAFQAGKYADWEQKMKTAESGAEIDLKGATGDLARSRADATDADTDFKRRTADAKVSAVETAAEQAAVTLKSAKTKQEVEAIEAEITKRRLEIEKDIPDEKIRAAALAKVDAAALAAREARARLKLTEATGRDKAGEADKSEITAEVLKSMDKQEQKEFLTKTGRYNTHVSSASAARDMYGSLYDSMIKTAPNDPRIKGKTREQFMLDGMTSQKSLDASTSLKNYIAAVTAANLDPDPDIVSSLSAIIKQGATAKAGTPTPAGTPAGQPEVWVRDKSGKLVKQQPGQPAAK